MPSRGQIVRRDRPSHGAAVILEGGRLTPTAGSRLGPYEILDRLGAGGMGEVYKARDTRLERSVAIKVLPEHLSSNSDLRARFEREARAASALNHPNICTLHDIGQHDGIDYVVLEHLEGETLADRLVQGPLAIDQVLRFGTEIADALGAAHKAGMPRSSPSRPTSSTRLAVRTTCRRTASDCWSSNAPSGTCPIASTSSSTGWSR